MKVTTEGKGITFQEKDFWYLPLDIPPPPLFKDSLETNVIPQQSIFTCLAKYDGETLSNVVTTGEKQKFKISQFPPYLIIVLKRFTKNQFYTEKNPTIVNFPLTNLDMSPYSSVEGMSVKYDLLANVRHEGKKLDDGFFKVHVHHRAANQWFDVQDLDVEKCIQQLIPVSESYLLLFKRQGAL